MNEEDLLKMLKTKRKERNKVYFICVPSIATQKDIDNIAKRFHNY